MAKAKTTKPEPKPHHVIPIVPKDFDGAVATHRAAVAAITYWKDRKDTAMFSDEENAARLMVSRWQQVKKDAVAIVASFQLKLF